MNIREESDGGIVIIGDVKINKLSYQVSSGYGNVINFDISNGVKTKIEKFVRGGLKDIILTLLREQAIEVRKYASHDKRKEEEKEKFISREINFKTHEDLKNFLNRRRNDGD